MEPISLRRVQMALTDPLRALVNVASGENCHRSSTYSLGRGLEMESNRSPLAGFFPSVHPNCIRASDPYTV